jgi:hypothetical protein
VVRGGLRARSVHAGLLWEQVNGDQFEQADEFNLFDANVDDSPISTHLACAANRPQAWATSTFHPAEKRSVRFTTTFTY